MTAKKKIEPLVLEIKGRRITAQKFMQTAQNFVGLLRNVADNMSGQQGAVTWLVAAEKGSQVFIAVPEADEKVVGNVALIPVAIHEGCHQIETSEKRPKGFCDTALRHARDLASVIGNGDGDVTKITLTYGKQTSNISSKTSLHVGEILGSKRSEDGSVEGRVTVLSDKKRFNVYIDDILTGHSVRCTPREVEEDKLIAAFRRRVVAIGTVHYRSDGAPVRIEVDRIRMLGKQETLPSFEDVRGIFRKGN